MKKRIALLLICALLLTGCSSAPDSTESTGTITPDISNTPTEEHAETGTVSMPMITVSVPVSVKETTADNGTVIFRSIQQSMQLVMPDQDVADQIIVDFLSRIDATAASAEQIEQQALSVYTGEDTWTPFLSSITYAPKRIDQCVLSLYGNTLRYSGGAHAEYISRAANYNVLTGDVLTLGSIVVNEESVDLICLLVIEKLQSVQEEKYLRDGFEETVVQRFNVEESYDEAWYFSENGLCFYFDPYEIGPYSSGVITAEIPYEELTGLIDDSFFTPEIDVTSGTVTTVPAEDADMSTFTRISEIVLKAEAPMYVIYTDGAVQNLRIEWNDATLSSFYTVFAAQSLSVGDAIVVQADPNLFSTLNIVYESNGQTVTVPLLP